MLQKRVPVWALVAVLGAVLLLFGIGSAIHSAGWSDGFMMGLLAGGNADGGSLAPYMAYQTGQGWRGGWGHPIGGFFRFLLLFFVIGLIFRFFGLLRWKMGGANHQRPEWWLHRRRHRHHDQDHGPQTQDSVNL